MSRGIGKVAPVGRSSKTRSQRWRIRLAKGLDLYVDKDGRSFYSREHAESTLDLIRAEMDPRHYRFDPDNYRQKKESRHTFRAFAESWLENVELKTNRGDYSPGYLNALRGYVHNHWIPFFQDEDLREIRGQQLTKFHLRLKIAPKSIYNCMAALHKLFTDAWNEELIEQLPRFPVSFKTSSIPQTERKWAPEDLQDAIFDKIDDPEALFFIYFQACHATRNGETRALQHGDIDLANDAVIIQRAFSGSTLRPYPKGKRSRVIPLDPAWKQMYLEKGRGLPGAFVFVNKQGRPYGKNWATRQWNEAVEKAEVSGVTLYGGTRHSLASQAVNRGESLYLVQKMLGHSDIRQTERYSHLATGPLRAVQRKGSLKAGWCKPGATRK
jgi:integrase